jgi:hypothetical protein
VEVSLVVEPPVAHSAQVWEVAGLAVASALVAPLEVVSKVERSVGVLWGVEPQVGHSAPSSEVEGSVVASA